MNAVIIFPNDVGGVAICYPALSCGLTIEEIARKDVPAGKPYLIVPDGDVPKDHTFFDAFEADFSQPHGYGIGSNAWFIEQYQAEIDALNAETYPEMELTQDVLQYANGLSHWQANKELRIAQLNAQIAVQQAEMQT